MDVDVGEGPADALGPDAQPVDVVDGERGGQRQDQRLIGVLPESRDTILVSSGWPKPLLSRVN